jgi:hypothetical protein
VGDALPDELRELPDELRELFPGGAADGRVLPADLELPPGRLVVPASGGRPAYWLCDDPDPEVGYLWSNFLDAHENSGLWPLLFFGPEGTADFWEDGPVRPEAMSDPAGVDADATLAAHWPVYDSPEMTAPFGYHWPGLAPVPGDDDYRDRVASAYLLADDIAVQLCDRHPIGSVRLGLVAAPSGAYALTVAGWDGPINVEPDTARISAVVRSWEERFGAVVVAVGPDLLHLSVSAPPTTHAQAMRVAVEHLAFCPANIWPRDGGEATLAVYALSIVDLNGWWFWWD